MTRAARARRRSCRGAMTSRFVARRVRPTNVKLRHADPGAELPACWLLAEWPDGKDAPTDFWLSNLPADTPIDDLVALAKLRWRVEQDYRELKDALGLGHFEGRSCPAGSTTSRSSRSPTAFSPPNGCAARHAGRPPDLTVRGRPGAPTAPSLLAGHLPNLPQTAAAHHPIPPRPTMT